MHLLPPGKILRRMGFPSDQQGLINRWITEGERWKTHLVNSRNYILQAVMRDEYRSVAILGSGWLLDVPLTELADLCETVYLFDIHHPVQVQHLVKRFPSVRLYTADITGGMVAQVYRLCRESKRGRVKVPLTALDYPLFRPEVDADVWVSVNLLSQVDSLMSEYIQELGIHDNEEINAFRLAVQQKHLEFLMNRRSVMITDFYERVSEPGKAAEYRRTVLVNRMPGAKNRKEWTWLFDNTGTYRPGTETRFRVMAVQF